MTQHAASNRKERGFSLIEVLVALLLFQLVLMVLMETAVVMTKTNFRNRLRDVAVSVTEEYLERYRNQKFEDIYPPSAAPQVYVLAANDPDPMKRAPKRVLGKTVYDFPMTITIQRVSGTNDLMTVQILTEWTILGKTFNHTASQVLKR
jgi:prepilin-type N-terminal cleavage/methylation domain-containing protein